jgi:hypothetical protein
VPFTGSPVADTTKPWPFMDDVSSIDDFFTAMHNYKRQCLLPHPATGLSAIQTFVRHMDSLKEQAFTASSHFHFPISMMYRHVSDLVTRNVDARKDHPFPVLLCNGPIPYDPVDVMNALIRQLGGCAVNYDTELRPCTKGDYNPWQPVYVDGVVTRLPYGMYPDDYTGYTDESSWGCVRLRGPCMSGVGVPSRVWECFDGSLFVTFTSLNEYLKYWIKTRLDVLVDELSEEALKVDYVRRRKEFIRKVFIQRKGDSKRYYMDYRKEEKERNLIREFGSNEFSQTPICEFGPDFDDSPDSPPEFVCARDLLKRKKCTNCRQRYCDRCLDKYNMCALCEMKRRVIENYTFCDDALTDILKVITL